MQASQWHSFAFPGHFVYQFHAEFSVLFHRSIHINMSAFGRGADHGCGEIWQFRVNLCNKVSKRAQCYGDVQNTERNLFRRLTYTICDMKQCKLAVDVRSKWAYPTKKIPYCGCVSITGFFFEIAINTYVGIVFSNQPFIIRAGIFKQCICKPAVWNNSCFLIFFQP